jgi:hypothetical protein
MVWSSGLQRHVVRIALAFGGIKYTVSIFSFEPASVGFYLGLLFHPEDGGDTFLRNVGLSRATCYLNSEERTIRDQVQFHGCLLPCSPELFSFVLIGA